MGFDETIARPRFEMVKIADLKPHPDQVDVRAIDAGALAGLEASISTFGLAQTVTINRRTMRIIGGHLRVGIMKKLGEVDVPAFVYDVDEDVEKALFVTLNNRAIEGHFTPGIRELVEGIRVEIPDAVFEGLHLDDAPLEVELAQFSVDIDVVDKPDPKERNREIYPQGSEFLIHWRKMFSAAHQLHTPGSGSEHNLHGHDFELEIAALVPNVDEGYDVLDGLVAPLIEKRFDRTLILSTRDPCLEDLLRFYGVTGADPEKNADRGVLLVPREVDLNGILWILLYELEQLELGKKDITFKKVWLSHENPSVKKGVVIS